MRSVASQVAIFTRTLNQCTGNSSNALEEGRWVHAKIKQAGLDTHIVVGTVLVSMYVRCGSLHDALQVFHRMPQRNVVSWTAMISGCAQLGDSLGAFKLFACMKSAGWSKPIISSFNNS